MTSKGTPTFILQRASAVLMLPLAIWLVWGLASHAGDSYAEMRQWLAAPATAILFALTIIVGAFHMRIGLGEVIHDYLHGAIGRLASLVNWLVAATVSLAALYAAYSLAFAG